MSITPSTAPVTEWRPHPAGAEGAKVSLEKCSERIRKDYVDPLVVAFARRVLNDRRDATSTKAKAQALLDAMKARARYILDPTNSEYIASAKLILCLDSTQKDYCHAGGDCFPEGTLLLRDDYELVPIEQIKVGDRIWGRDKWSRVEGKKFKGTLAVDAIELNNGATMCLTADHKVYVGRCEHGAGCVHSTCQQAFKKTVSYDRISVGDLTEGDVLLRPDRIAFGSQEPDPDRTYVDGLYLSEGWSEDSRFAISGQDGCRKEALKHEVRVICERLGISTYWHRKYIRVNDADWAHELAERGTRARFKNAKTLNLGEAAAAALLRGIMSDSTANGRGPGRTFNTTSRTLAVQTRVLHRMFGVSTSMRMLTPEQHGGEGTHPLWRMGTRARSEDASRAEWTLSVRSIDRGAMKVPCWDIQTDDHYVYLPEHDVTVSNCDELTCTLCSMLMAVGIDVKLVAQGFSSTSKVPTHVLLAAFDPSSESWFKIDPSTSLPVGKSYPSSFEVEVDPLTGAVPDFSGPGPQVSFVGVGAHGHQGIRKHAGLGLTLPGEVIAYRQLWNSYVIGTAQAALTCSQQAPPAGSNLTQQLFTTNFQDYSDSIVSGWNIHANSQEWQTLLFANDYLQDFQKVIVAVGNFYQPQIRASCPNLKLPPLPNPADQSAVVAALENARIISEGTLQLFGIGAGGAIEYVDKFGKKAADLVTTTVNYIPWIVGGVIAVAGAVIVSDLVAAQRLAATLQQRRQTAPARAGGRTAPPASRRRSRR